MKNNKKRILVTGGDGQLAMCIKDKKNRFLFNGEEYIFMNKKELDITNESKLYETLYNIKPTIIINCAAYTNVENAEKDECDKAFLINKDACTYLSKWCKDNDALLIHISTDYVFDGNLGRPYRENEPTVPQNIYGKSKLYGENEIIRSKCNYIILRTSWLYSSYSNNFFKVMFKKILNANVSTLYAPIDEISIPTNANNLANAIINISHEYLEREDREDIIGVYQYTDDGMASRYDFLSAIYEYINSEFKTNTAIIPCYKNKFPTNVKRPSFSVMDNNKIKDKFNSVTTENWRVSLKKEIDRMMKGIFY